MKNRGTVSLEGIEFFAYHGIYDFEREKGNIFWVDIYMTKGYSNNQLSDLDSTVDYEKVYALLNTVMQQPEDLLETVAKKLIHAVAEAFPSIEKMQVKIKKHQPPILDAKVNYSAFELEWINPNFAE